MQSVEADRYRLAAILNFSATGHQVGGGADRLSQLVAGVFENLVTYPIIMPNFKKVSQSARF